MWFIMSLGAAMHGSALVHAAPTVNGLFHGDGDANRYVLYNTSVGGSKLWYTVAGNRLFVALVVDRSVNDNVFSSNRDYTRDAGWNPPRDASKLINSEYARFTLAVGEASFEWNQGYGERVDGVWKSDHTTGAGSGTPPPGYISSSSFAWNINTYLANPAPTWNLYANGTGMNDWKSPFRAAVPNVVLGLEGYPASGDLGFSEFFQWEWSMVYEWSADLSSFGTAPVFVISGQSHHSPAKTGSEDDPFPTPPGNGYLTDYGDLPAPYPTLLASDGARHYIVPNGAFLGASADPEPDGIPHPLALGDDASASADEDGVELLTALVAGQSARLRVTAGSPGFLSAFIDFDGDGALDPVALVSASGPTALTPGVLGDAPLAAGVYDLEIAVPADAAGPMPARFRYTNATGQGGNQPAGLASTGEVEDYLWGAVLGDRVWDDRNRNGVQDPDEVGMGDIPLSVYRIDGITRTWVAATTSAPDGSYGFADLPPGTYEVMVDATHGHAVSLRGQGTDTARDSDIDPVTLRTLPITLGPGERRTDIDIGLYYAPTLATILSFHAEEHQGTTVVRWTVGMEQDTLRYRLERREHGAWVPVPTDEPIWAASAENPIGPYAYEVADHHAAPGRAHTWRIVEEENDGDLHVYGPYTASASAPAASYEMWAGTQAWAGASAHRGDDPDGDGLNNQQEFLAGTDPLDAGSALRIRGIRRTAAGLEIEWPSTPGRTYVVEKVRRLGDPWKPVARGLGATPPHNRAVVPDVDQAFFRVVLKVPDAE